MLPINPTHMVQCMSPFGINIFFMFFTLPYLSSPALNNNQWHHLDVSIKISTGELTVQLDNETTVTTLKSYTRQEFSTLLDWTKHSSAIYFGGKKLHLFIQWKYLWLWKCPSSFDWSPYILPPLPLKINKMSFLIIGQQFLNVLQSVLYFKHIFEVYVCFSFLQLCIWRNSLVFMSATLLFI